MKKILLILAAAATTLAASSQTKELDNLAKRLQKSDEAIADPKKSTSANTWLDHASALIAASKVYTKTLVADFPIEQTLALVGEQPDEIVEVTVMDQPHKKYVFDNFDIYVNQNGQVVFWQTKNEFRAGALDKALEAFKKACELDPSIATGKGYLVGDDLLNQFNTNGMNNYNLGQKIQAAEKFAKVVEINQMLGNTDSVMLYYTGVAYSEGEDYDKALEYLNKAREIGYDQEGGVDFYIAYMQEKQGKKEDAIATLENALTKYPSDNRMVTQLINLYIDTQRSPDTVVSLLDKAKELDPSNVSLYMLEGTLWEKMGNADKAEAAFVAATKVAPDDYAPYMNAGIMEARKGDALIEQARKLDLNDVKGYEALAKEAIGYYNVAIEYLEKAHELNSKEIGIVEMLKGLYYQKLANGEEVEAKFQHYTDLYRSLEDQAESAQQ